jgi:hypothetical protein
MEAGPFCACGMGVPVEMCTQLSLAADRLLEKHVLKENVVAELIEGEVDVSPVMQAQKQCRIHRSPEVSGKLHRMEANHLEEGEQINKRLNSTRQLPVHAIPVPPRSCVAHARSFCKILGLAGAASQSVQLRRCPRRCACWQRACELKFDAKI